MSFTLSRLINSLAVSFFACAPAFCAEAIQAPFNTDSWIFTGDMAAQTFEGREALDMQRGSATLSDVSLGQGVIEFDVWFEDKRQFPGFAFRGVDDQNYEYFYFRPHQSGNPDATQYSPVFNGLTAWQIYTGPGYSNAVELRHGKWMNVRLEIYDDSAQVFYGGESALYIPDLEMDQKDGYFRFRSSRSGTYISNFSYKPVDDLADPGGPAAEEEEQDGSETEDAVNWTYVTDWMVSGAMDESDAEDMVKSGKWVDTDWHEPGTEYNHFVNISKAAQRPQDGEAAIARFNLSSETPKDQAVSFGFSDHVRVFVNGREVYRGDDGFLTRDYRFLGTVGFFDEVILPLKAGDNDIAFIVSESFGGWGVGARMKISEVGQ